MRPFVTIGEEAADTTKAVRPLVEEEIEHHRPKVDEVQAMDVVRGWVLGTQPKF